MYDTSVIRSAQIVFVAGDPAGKVINAQPGLRNIESRGMLIDQILIESEQAGSTGALVELKWRDNPITNGFITLGAVARVLNRRMETGAAAGPVSALKFARPIYLPASEYISVAVQNSLANGGTGLTTLNISAVGRLVDEVPAERYLPYLADYLGPVYTDNTGNAISDQSTPGDLANPFGVPLTVERLVGRVLVAAATGGPYRDADPAAIWTTYLIRISDHRDHFWTPVATPFAIVFNSSDRSWILNMPLEPKGFLRAEFEGTANVVGAGFSRVAIGMLGYRRIS